MLERVVDVVAMAMLKLGVGMAQDDGRYRERRAARQGDDDDVQYI